MTPESSNYRHWARLSVRAEQSIGGGAEHEGRGRTCGQRPKSKGCLHQITESQLISYSGRKENKYNRRGRAPFPSPTTLPAYQPLTGAPHTLLLYRPFALSQPCCVAQERWEPGEVHRGLQHVAGGPRLWGHNGHWLPDWEGEGGQRRGQKSVKARESLSQAPAPGWTELFTRPGPFPTPE